MPIKGANQVRGRLQQTVRGITDKKAHQFVNAVLAQVGILSKEKAPLEYGTLHNSQRIDVVKESTRIVGSLSYNTMYAAILNNGQYQWNPRPPALKAGPAWNPNATPHFLEYGFESPEGQAVISRFVEIFRL